MNNVDDVEEKLGNVQCSESSFNIEGKIYENQYGKEKRDHS